MMRALVIEGYGTTPAIVDVTLPQPQAGQILIRVEAAALNPLDAKILAGWMHDFFPVQFPYKIGTDLAGEIIAVGTDVVAFSPGDRVVARTNPGDGAALADHALFAADLAVKVVYPLPPSTLAALPTTAGTAWQALMEEAPPLRGQRVLVQGGAGGVGRYAVQIARLAGAEVVATGASRDLEEIRRYGAALALDYAAVDLIAQIGRVDVAIDTVGGAATAVALGALRQGGLFLNMPQPLDEAQAKGIAARFVFHSNDARRLAKLVEATASGQLVSGPIHEIGLADASRALSEIAAGTRGGKTVVVF